MDIKEVKELLQVFEQSGSSYLSIEMEGTKIKMKKPSETQVTQTVIASQASPSDAVQAAPSKEEVESAEEAGEKVLAPLVGVFYAAPSPEEAAYVQVGDRVKKGQVLCLIEAMKMMSEITSPSDGLIKKIYVKNQDIVGFEEPLFLIGD